MSTYEEFMIIIATASLIVAIVNLTQNKVCFVYSRKHSLLSDKAHFAAPSVFAMRYLPFKRVRILSGALFALQEFPRKAKIIALLPGKIRTIILI